MLSARMFLLNVEIGDATSHCSQHCLFVKSLLERCQSCNFGVFGLFFQTLLLCLFLFNLLLSLLASLSSSSLRILFLGFLRRWSFTTFGFWISSSSGSLSILLLLPDFLFELLVAAGLSNACIPGCTIEDLGINHLLMAFVGQITEARVELDRDEG